MSAAEASDLEIRAATPADLAALMEAHRIAFAGTMGVALGVRYRRAFISRFIDDPDQVALLALRDGQIVGYVLGRSVKAPDNDRATKIAAALGLLTHPWLLARPTVRREVLSKTINRGATAEVAASLPTDGGDLVGIGSVPSERGRGTATALITAFEDWCAERGWRTVMLSVYRDNVAARRLYASRGYVEHPHASDDLLYEVKNLPSER